MFVFFHVHNFFKIFQHLPCTIQMKCVDILDTPRRILDQLSEINIAESCNFLFICAYWQHLLIVVFNLKLAFNFLHKIMDMI